MPGAKVLLSRNRFVDDASHFRYLGVFLRFGEPGVLHVLSQDRDDLRCRDRALRSARTGDRSLVFRGL
jgi:hypothetical protein